MQFNSKCSLIQKLFRKLIFRFLLKTSKNKFLKLHRKDVFKIQTVTASNRAMNSHAFFHAIVV